MDTAGFLSDSGLKARNRAAEQERQRAHRKAEQEKADARAALERERRRAKAEDEAEAAAIAEEERLAAEKVRPIPAGRACFTDRAVFVWSINAICCSFVRPRMRKEKGWLRRAVQ